MKFKKLLALTLALMLLLCGCKDDNIASDENNSSTDTESTASTTEISFAEGDSEMFTDRDSRTEYDESVLITLNGNSASCDDKRVSISGSKVTITDEGTYVISGTLSDGMIIVNAEETDKPQIVLNGASVTSKTSAPFYIIEADKVFVTLADGTKNTLANGGTFEAIDENNIDGAVFSKQDLTINGTGALTVTSPAGHGIVCKDDLVFTGGNYTVNSASHALDVNDSVRIKNAVITADAGKDGIHCENSDDASKGFVYVSGGTVNIEAEGDGISAEAYAQIENGTFNITAGGGSENGTKSSSDNYGGFMGGRPDGRGFSQSTTSEDSTSMKGIKATGSMLIKNGTLNINSADDAVHSNASVTVNGGTFNIASGDDGFHADETLTVTNGKIVISECYEGLEALDIAVSGGDIKLVASDDGLNAAGGTDSSGTGGRGGDMFGGRGGGMGGMGGSSSSNGSITVSGGTLYINSSGDGIDANGTLEISGGYTTVVGPTQGDTATLDYDTSGIITGGTFIGTGASNMAQSFSDSKNQGVIAVSVGNQSKGTQITVKNKKGKEILSYSPELSYAVVIISSPDIEKGEAYTVTVGSQSAEVEAN